LKSIVFFLVGLCGVVALFYFSWIPSPKMAEVSWLPPGLGAMLDSPAWRDPRTALPCVLLGVFAGCAMPFCGSYVRQYAILGTFVLPLAAELGQIFVPHRTCSFWDVLWGWGGISFGLLMVWLFRLAKRGSPDGVPAKSNTDGGG
jgi:hypothetical protein